MKGAWIWGRGEVAGLGDVDGGETVVTMYSARKESTFNKNFKKTFKAKQTQLSLNNLQSNVMCTVPGLGVAIRTTSSRLHLHVH